jgi:hypothetical protein
VRDGAQTNNCCWRDRRHRGGRNAEPEARLNVKSFFRDSIAYPLQIAQAIDGNVRLTRGSAWCRHYAAVRHSTADGRELKSLQCCIQFQAEVGWSCARRN